MCNSICTPPRWHIEKINGRTIPVRVYKVAALGLLAIMPIVAMACGGSSSKTSNTPGSSGSTTANGTAGSNSSPSAGATSGSTGSDNPLTDLQNAGKALKNGNFKLSYDMTQTDTSGAATKGTMEFSSKGNKSYFKMTGLTGASTGAYIIIDDGTNSFVCMDQPTKQCLKSASSAGAGSIADAFQPTNILNELSASGGKFKQVGDQTIAGRSAKCYQGSDTSGSGTACIDKKDSVLLLVDSTQSDGSKMTLKATQVGSASDSDFTPPYTVQSVPGQ